MVDSQRRLLLALLRLRLFKIVDDPHPRSTESTACVITAEADSRSHQSVAQQLATTGLLGPAFIQQIHHECSGFGGCCRDLNSVLHHGLIFLKGL